MPPGFTLDQLRTAVSQDRIDTVLLALTDMQGRLQGKRLDARHFLKEVVGHGAEACNYLLAVDVEMNTVSGYAMSSWERGYGDFEMVPDFDTLRPVPWHEKTALCLADLRWSGGEPVVASPRQILRAQLERLSARGLEAFAGTELEFIVFKDTYEEAFEKGYSGLRPANQYNVDYSLLGTARVEPLIGRIRREMTAAGLVVEDSKGECNDGQHEINFHYGPALQTADEHSIYKTAAKEIAALEGCLDHVHGQVQRARRLLVPHPHVRGGPGRGRLRPLRGRPARVPAGADAAVRAEHQLLQALRGRLVRADRGGLGARQPHVRGARAAQPVRAAAARARTSTRTCALSAMIAAGLHGLDAELELEEPTPGNAYVADKPHVPKTLLAARELFAASEVARAAFGEEVVAHYLNNADVELAAFEAAVTDWERVRGFERL